MFRISITYPVRMEKITSSRHIQKTPKFVSGAGDLLQQQMKCGARNIRHPRFLGSYLVSIVLLPIAKNKNESREQGNKLLKHLKETAKTVSKLLNAITSYL